jgi:hypothetical protein
MKPEPPNLKPADEPPCPKCKSNNVQSPFWAGIYRMCPDCGHSWQKAPSTYSDWNGVRNSQFQLTIINQRDHLLTAIRKHRDYRGDDRCWLDDQELYQSLPEGYTPPVTEVEVELHNCERFLACRRNPATQYVSPQRQIEELESHIETLADVTERLIGAADRQLLSPGQLNEARTAIANTRPPTQTKPVCKFSFQTPVECRAPVSTKWTPDHGLPYCDRHQPDCFI